MPKIYSATENVYTAAKQRIREQYLAGHRLVYSISGGKDSTILMEVAIAAARELGMLPIECITRDEEIMYPGTFEYLERVYARQDEVKLYWVISGQAIINAYNRFSPYWWVFDPLEQDKWVRQPPPWAIWIDEQDIGGMTIPDRFPPHEGNLLIASIGLRAAESLTRTNRIASTEGAMTKKPNAYGVYNFAPIYDWTDDDVWRAIREFGWDYNDAYNKLFQIGVPKTRLRIAPPSMRQGMDTLKYALKLWPSWFDKVDARLPGIRTAARFGRRALRPTCRPGQTWQDRMQEIIDEATEKAPWLADRAIRAVKSQLSGHAHHSTQPLPMLASNACLMCKPARPGSWEGLAYTLYNGDPWSNYNMTLPPLEPYMLREGARQWFSHPGKKSPLHW